MKISFVAIQILMFAITVLMFGVGFFSAKGLEAMEGKGRLDYERMFDQKMRPIIGKPYTEETHYKLLDVMRISDEQHASSGETLMAAAQVIRNVGGLLAIGTLVITFLFFRATRSAKPEKPGLKLDEPLEQKSLNSIEREQ